MARLPVTWIACLLLAACGADTEAPTTHDGVPVTDAAPAAPQAFLPRLVDGHLPPPLKGLVPGRSTVEDVHARHPDLEVDRDRSLGGDMAVAHDGRAAVAMRLPYHVGSGPRGRADGIEELSLFFVPDAQGVPRLVSMRLVTSGSLCAWLDEHVGSDPQAMVCPGVRRKLGVVGRSGDRRAYCLGTPDGEAGILVECGTTRRGRGEIAYDLLTPDGAR